MYNVHRLVSVFIPHWNPIPPPWGKAELYKACCVHLWMRASIFLFIFEGRVWKVYNRIHFFSNYSLDILRRPQKFGPFSTFYLTLLSSVNSWVEDGLNFCGFLRIFKLYLEILLWMNLYIFFFENCWTNCK